jgi:hypothetical protein
MVIRLTLTPPNKDFDSGENQEIIIPRYMIKSYEEYSSALRSQMALHFPEILASLTIVSEKTAYNNPKWYSPTATDIQNNNVGFFFTRHLVKNGDSFQIACIKEKLENSGWVEMKPWV